MKRLLFSAVALLFLASRADALGVDRGNSITGNAATVTTNANLTGPVTSVGNATSIPGPVPPAAVNLSTVTTALGLKVDTNTPAQVNLSTVTTALALKADLAGANFTGASQFGNAMASISSFTAAGFFTPPAYTKTAIDTLNGVLGALIICTDCAQPYDVCVGTGTAASQWRALANSSESGIIGGGPAGCGSGN